MVVFDLLKRGGSVHTKIFADTRTITLMPVITGKVAPVSVVYTDSHRSYNALDVTDFHHLRVNHGMRVWIYYGSPRQQLEQLRKWAE